MHLVVGTRVDPPLALARLRGRGQVVELRLADLRFTVEETTTFLNDRLGLDLAPDEVGILHAHSEGWAVGLRLLAGSLRRLPPDANRRTYIRHMAGFDRHVFDFLTEEVFDQQEPEIWCRDAGPGLSRYPPSTAFFLFLAGRVRWLQGRVKEARELYAQMCGLEDPQRETPDARVYRTWMWSLLAEAEGHYGEAERALRRPDVLEQRDGCSTIGGSTCLMLARLHLRQNRQEEALAELASALAYHEQRGLPFPILVEGQSIVPLLRLAVERGVHARYAAHLLELLGADDEPRSIPVPHTGETLTAREAEVLQLVVAGYSNRTIAEELIISQWTVKSHLTRVYRKLDVDSRTQAIARARDLGLG
jgi:ATP/maltotriose-dependent transcriptional regulator MalT